MNICEKIGNNVRNYRLKARLSQEKLAELCDFHRTYISDVERGKRSISLNNIEKLSNALNVNIVDLFKF